jgi:hypothetical protein
VVAQLRRPAIAEDFLINCVPFLSNFVKTLNTLNNLKLEQDTVRLQGGVRDQIGAVELTGWSTFEHGGRAADGIGVGGGRTPVRALESGRAWCQGCRRMGEQWPGDAPGKHRRLGSARERRPGHGEGSGWAASVGRLLDLRENGGVSRG